MKRRFFLVFSCVILVLACVLFLWIEGQAAAPTPVPSVQAGYYDEPFLLELTAPARGTIYYTTDGSTPTTDSQLYQGGIEIQDRSSEPNLYQSQQRVVADWKNYTPNTTPVPKGTVIRAIFVNALGISSDVLTQTYFVGLQPPETGYTLSLVFEYTDMFGKDGIHITGSGYDQWYLAGGDPALEQDAWFDVTDLPDQQAVADNVPNFFKRIEIPATAELMEAGSDVMNQAVGLRIQGNSARTEAKKPLVLAAREEYSGSSVFDAILFDGVTTHSVMTKSYMTDIIIRDLASDRDVALQDHIPVQIYFNGEYWRTCYLLERYDKHYFRQHYQVEDRVLVKDGIIDETEVPSSEIDYYNEYTYWITTADFTDPKIWEQFQAETDVQSLIDYLIINYYLCNIDFTYYTNHIMWRCPVAGSGEYQDTRWRWCVYDIGALEWIPNDPSLGKPAALNLFEDKWLYSSNYYYRCLKPSEEFSRQYVLTFMDMVNNNFAPEHVQKVLSQYGLDLTWLDGFFLERPGYAMKYLAEEFDLTGDPHTITISQENPQAGHITVNTSQIDLSSGSWTGQYFSDYPITITAVPAEGYQFIGWKGDAEGTAQTISLTVNAGIALEAVFAEQ